MFQLPVRDHSCPDFVAAIFFWALFQISALSGGFVVTKVQSRIFEPKPMKACLFVAQLVKNLAGSENQTRIAGAEIRNADHKTTTTAYWC